MSVDERRAVIRQNKDKGCGKGIKRQVKVSEKAECSDSLKLGQDKPFLTKKQLLVLLLCLALDFWIKQYYVIICCSFLANDAHICFVLNSTGSWQSWRRDTIGHRKIMKRNGRQQSQIPRRYGAKMTMEFQVFCEQRQHPQPGRLVTERESQQQTRKRQQMWRLRSRVSQLNQLTSHHTTNRIPKLTGTPF